MKLVFLGLMYFSGAYGEAPGFQPPREMTIMPNAPRCVYEVPHYSAAEVEAIKNYQKCMLETAKSVTDAQHPGCSNPTGQSSPEFFTRYQAVQRARFHVGHMIRYPSDSASKAVANEMKDPAFAAVFEACKKRETAAKEFEDKCKAQYSLGLKLLTVEKCRHKEN
jgi:hypothetical protein